MTRPAARFWRAPLIALGLAFVALAIVLLFGLGQQVDSDSGRWSGFAAGLITTLPLGMASAAIVASGQARRFAIPVPFVVALAALVAIAFAMLDLALASALAGTPQYTSVAAARAAEASSANLRTGFILLGLVLFAATATALSALASRRGATSGQVAITQLLLALACLPLVNVVGAAIWFSTRFGGRGLPVAPDEFLPPKEKPTT